MTEQLTFRVMWRLYHECLPGHLPVDMASMSEAAFYAGGMAMLRLIERAFAAPSLEKTVDMLDELTAEMRAFKDAAQALVKADAEKK